MSLLLPHILSFADAETKIKCLSLSSRMLKTLASCKGVWQYIEWSNSSRITKTLHRLCSRAGPDAKRITLNLNCTMKDLYTLFSRNNCKPKNLVLDHSVIRLISRSDSNTQKLFSFIGSSIETFSWSFGWNAGMMRRIIPLLSNLKKLTLEGGDSIAFSVTQIMTSLQELLMRRSVSSTVTWKGSNLLTKCPNLKILDLSGHHFNSSITLYKAFKSFKSLKKLNLSDTTFTDASYIGDSLLLLMEKRTLTDLNVSGMKDLTEFDLKCIALASESLLNLNCSKLLPSALALSKNRITSLTLSECHFKEQEWIRILNAFQMVQMLDLSNNFITDKVIEKISEMSELRELNISNCSHLTGGGRLLKINEYCDINVSGCNNMRLDILSCLSNRK